MILEEVIEFGLRNQLVGIVSRPDVVDTVHPAIVFINAGVLHRAGACRSSVTLSRSLTREGYPCLRFDLYGIGDSGFGGMAKEDALSTKPEISEALNMLQEKYGIQSFVLHGLCSGARDAFATAVQDERVVGLSMIDGYAYRTLRFYLNKLPAFMKNPSRWLNFIRVRVNSVQKGQPQDDNTLLELPAWPDYPPKHIVEAGFSVLSKRNVKLLTTYTGSWVDEYNYDNQFRDMYPSVQFGRSLSMNYMPEANHIMTERRDQKALRDQLLNFLAHT